MGLLIVSLFLGLIVISIAYYILNTDFSKVQKGDIPLYDDDPLEGTGRLFDEIDGLIPGALNPDDDLDDRRDY